MKCGDIVQLKSGSPDMTVISIVGNRVEVWWFVDADLQKAAFHVAMLISEPADGQA